MKLHQILHLISATCSSLVLFTLIVFAIIDLSLVNRVTVRLICGVAIADLISHIAGYLQAEYFTLINTPLCEHLVIFALFGRLLYYFTNLAICYHLYRAIVMLKKSTFKYELIVWFFIMLCIAILMVISHFLGLFTGLSRTVACNPGSTSHLNNKIAFGISGTISLITILAGIFTTVQGHRSMSQWIQLYSVKTVEGDFNQQDFQKKKIKRAQRSFLYPLGTIITISVETAVQYSWFFTALPPRPLYTANAIMNGTNGIVTMITFLLDPAVWDSIKLAKNKIIGFIKGNNYIILSK
jgi:hypothetical protein